MRGAPAAGARTAHRRRPAARAADARPATRRAPRARRLWRRGRQRRARAPRGAWPGRRRGRAGRRPASRSDPTGPSARWWRHGRAARLSAACGELNWLQMAPEPTPELTARQREILSQVVQEYVATGQPVGSKHLVERAGLSVSPSTVRNELADLEALGLLTHPHTSAGRLPTERGYRFYAAELVARSDARGGVFPLDLSALRREVDSALQAATEMLSSVTRLLALVSAPPLESTTVRHVEVLVLQPRTVMVVVITSTGRVTKRAFPFAAPVDAGLANWAREYLNERLAGARLGSAYLRRQLDEESLSPPERAFLDVVRPAFVELAD
ncbi:MAG: hypothetical protein E6G60_04960, partial [Actinobacteria bacterium]